MSKINILVVDDRPEGVLAVQAVLSSPSYNIVTASSGNEALKHLLHDDFAVILMDVQMPIMNGFETASIIKTREKSKDIPIIFMSAINQDEQYVYQGYGVGAIDYILKPFDPYILRSKVAIFVDLYRKNILVKEQAQKLRESEAQAHAQQIDNLEIANLRRYQNLADSIPQIVFKFTRNGEYEYFNKVWFEYTGLTINNSNGEKWKNVFHPEDLGKLNKLFSSIEIPELLECECRILNRNGDFLWHLIRFQPENMGDQEIRSWLGTATDIEARKKQEFSQIILSEVSEQLISSLELQSSLDKVFPLMNPNFSDWMVVELTNDGKLDNKLNLSIKEKIQREASESFYNENFKREGSSFHINSVLESGKKKIYNDFEVKGSNVLMLPLCLHGQVMGVLTVVNDLSGRTFDKHSIDFFEEVSRRMTLALENAKLYKLSQMAVEARNDFLSIASHELNTPITSLKLQLQMIKKGLLLNKEGEFPIERFSKSVDASVKQVDRLINLIQILLDVSRIQSGKFMFNFESLNANRVFEEVLERNKELIQNSESQLELEGKLDVTVRWDKTRVEQLVTNLLTNAIKYAPGKIKLCLKDVGNDIQIDVADFGEGIPESKLNTIFDRFERASSSENISGLGLGLFIVKQIVEGHHGRVSVKSTIGKGTTFSVWLPKDALIEKDSDREEDQLH